MSVRSVAAPATTPTRSALAAVHAAVTRGAAARRAAQAQAQAPRAPVEAVDV